MTENRTARNRKEVWLERKGKKREILVTKHHIKRCHFYAEILVTACVVF